MKNKWDKILNELSYRVSTGIPDLSNEQHLMKLWDILKEHNWNLDARVELLKNLDEQDKPSVQSILNRSFKNAQSGRMIKVSSALGYKNKPTGQAAYGVAKGMMSDAGYGKEAEKIANKKGSEEKPQEREPQDENTPEQNRQKDIELVETQLFMFDGDPQEKGGAGTPESRTGECVTTYAGRRIKELMPPNGKMSYADAREQVRQELLKQANATNEEGKKSLLTEEWVESGLRCLDWIEENIKLENVEDFAWDTPEGNELVGAKGHGTSADMFIKTTDGEVIGISLKKDFKVFVYNGGYDKNIKKFAEDMGFELQDLPPELLYEGNENAYKERKQKIFDESIEKFNDEEVKKKVCALLSGGGYAEYAVCNISTVLPVPDGISLLDACTIPETFFTVWTNLFDQGNLKNNETLLVHGGASGIGLTAISIAKALNIRSLATVGSSEKKAAIDELNIERCINYQIEDFENIIKNEYSGVDVILDIVGGEYFQKNINILNKHGRLINIAYLKGSRVEVDLMPIMLKRLLISGSTLRVRSNKEKQKIADALRANIWPLIENEDISLFVDKRYDYTNVKDAHKYMENNKNIGKILLKF